MPEHADERLMARTAVRAGAALLVPALLAAGTLRGAQGALTALGALALVFGNFVVTALALRKAAAYGPAAVQAVTLGGFLVKLVVLAAAIVLLHDVAAIDGPVLALTTVVATIVLLTIEVRLVLRTAGFWWLNPDHRPASAANGRAEA